MKTEIGNLQLPFFLEDNFRCASIMEKERVLELDEFLYRNEQ